MDEQNSIELTAEALNELKKTSGFDISISDDIPSIEDNPKFRKLALTNGQKMQMTSLINSMPMFAAAKATSDVAKKASRLYIISCPFGIENTLTRMSTGNYSNFIRIGNRFAGYAPMIPVSAVSDVISLQAAAESAFAVMSVAVNQYYLNQINNELTGIKKGMDDILAFLYGDKKAELMSEIIFAKYAHENYSAIMAHGEQVSATIASLQQAKKIAMKDSEFYISDIASAMQENSSIDAIVEKACSISESLDLALQLAVMSSVLEVCYSQNFDKTLLDYIEKEMSLYIDKCEKFKLSAFSKLHQRVESYKNLPPKKIDKDILLEKINAVLEPLSDGGESSLKKTLREGLYSSGKRGVYYLREDGSIYIKEL